MSLYRKFKIKYSFARNMFTMSKMDYCMSDVTSEVVNKSIQKVHDTQRETYTLTERQKHTERETQKQRDNI